MDVVNDVVIKIHGLGAMTIMIEDHMLSTANLVREWTRKAVLRFRAITWRI